MLVATGATVVLVQGRPSDQAPVTQPAVRTVTVQRADLANTASLPANVGFGPPRPVKGTGTGTVTKLPAVGQVAERGKELFRVDDQPVVVFFGATPLFRRLEAPGTTGSDVAVVIDNLAALGHRAGSRPKDATKAEYTPSVIEAVKRWQRSLGLEPTGVIDPGRVFVAGGPVRVSAVKAQLGVPVTEELFEVTSTARLVTAQVLSTDAGPARAQMPVVIVRPDAREVPGKITSVTHLPPAQDGAGAPKVEIIAVPDQPDDVSDLDIAPAQIRITTESRAGVLTVPLEALVALQEGGYAVQLPNGELKAVQTGLYSQNKVEISGADIVDGMQVVAAQ
ncbi:peptidoglycan-binding protein [Kibdelosporangium persicum]|uniref:peptidoglycan-binding protein n=1 Tax=Kibdelosporangium persicum TaxID=2698649 RepID=UPI0015631C0B|nr:peptidoglycan-binding protein [Kibdelosporangium persicum]